MTKLTKDTSYLWGRSEGYCHATDTWLKFTEPHWCTLLYIYIFFPVYRLYYLARPVYQIPQTEWLKQQKFTFS